MYQITKSYSYNCVTNEALFVCTIRTTFSRCVKLFKHCKWIKEQCIHKIFPRNILKIHLHTETFLIIILFMHAATYSNILTHTQTNAKPKYGNTVIWKKISIHSFIFLYFINAFVVEIRICMWLGNKELIPSP